jgi:hypothetical protein
MKNLHQQKRKSGKSLFDGPIPSYPKEISVPTSLKQVPNATSFLRTSNMDKDTLRKIAEMSAAQFSAEVSSNNQSLNRQKNNQSKHKSK